MALGRDAALVSEGGLTVLCILARELAVGANKVEVLFLLLFVLPLPSSFCRMPDRILGFFNPIELAADVRSELPVPPELVLDPRVPPALARLLVRNTPLGGCWNEGMGPRRSDGIPDTDEVVFVRVIPDETVLDPVPIIELVPFIPILADDFLSNPIPVAGTRKLVIGPDFAVVAFATECLTMLGFTVCDGFVRIFGVSFLAAGAVFWDGPGMEIVEPCLEALLPTPFQTFLTKLLADAMKPNLVAIPFFVADGKIREDMKDTQSGLTLAWNQRRSTPSNTHPTHTTPSSSP